MGSTGLVQCFTPPKEREDIYAVCQCIFCSFILKLISHLNTSSQVSYCEDWKTDYPVGLNLQEVELVYLLAFKVVINGDQNCSLEMCSCFYIPVLFAHQMFI